MAGRTGWRWPRPAGAGKRGPDSEVSPAPPAASASPGLPACLLCPSGRSPLLFMQHRLAGVSSAVYQVLKSQSTGGGRLPLWVGGRWQPVRLSGKSTFSLASGLHAVTLQTCWNEPRSLDCVYSRRLMCVDELSDARLEEKPARGGAGNQDPASWNRTGCAWENEGDFQAARACATTCWGKGRIVQRPQGRMGLKLEPRGGRPGLQGGCRRIPAKAPLLFLLLADWRSLRYSLSPIHRS